MRRVFFFVFISFIFLSSAFAQNGTIKGSILDQDTGEPLIGATVLIKETKKGAVADLSGTFTLGNIAEGNYSLLFSYIGYENFSRNVKVGAGENVEVGEIKLTNTTIGLSEVEVFASLIEDRKTPVAVSTINALDIEQRFVGSEIADIVQSTPGIYAIQGAGGYGDQEVYIRGFDQSNVAFLVNGIPVNDMENGRMFWSNFAGLSEVTRQLQVQRGLGASKLAISSIGGTVNMITKPADRSEGGRVEYQTGTGAWNQRFRFTYNTGVMDGGWAVSFQGSRTQTNAGLIGLSSSEQGSVVPGAFTDAWSYYLSISKEINNQHSLMFWGFGAPVNRGTAWVVDDAAREEFNIQSPIFNNALGLYRGEIYNARQNKIHKPLMALSHFWTIDERSNLSTSFYASFANVYSTQPRDGESSLFFPERFKSNPALTTDNLINWDYLAEQNRDPSRMRTIEFPNGDLDTPVLEGFESQYYLEARYNNHEWYGLISNYRRSFNKLNILGGVDLRYYKGLHHAEVFELFGGDFVLNQSRFGDDLNKLNPVAVARKGDRINYDYDGVIRWGAVFGQAEYTTNKFNVFATATATRTSYTRIGNFWNGRPIYNDNSLGKSETRGYTTITAKGGVNYRPTNRHSVYANAGIFTRPPFFRNIYTDARYSNEYRPDIRNEKVNTVEVGYGYNMSKLRVNTNYYLTFWRDRTTALDITSSDQTTDGDGVDLTPGDEIPILLNGLTSRHEGVELEFKFNATSNLELNGFISYGDWKWDNNTSVDVTFEANGQQNTVNKAINLKGFPVGATAQTTAGFGIHYSGLRSMYIGGRMNYSDRISVRYSPEDIADGFITPDVIENAFDDYATVQLYAGKYLDFSDDLRGRLSVSVQNLFNAEYVRWSSYFFSQFQNAFGYPRTYTISLRIDF